jgi:hypothetical protein
MLADTAREYMKDGKHSEMKTAKKRIIKANIYKPHSGVQAKNYLSGYYHSNRSRHNSDNDTNHSEVKTKESKTPMPNTTTPTNAKIFNQVDKKYKDLEQRRRKMDSPGKYFCNDF